MLCFLRIHDFAIIEQLEVEFGPGLNVITGETGAGKSILVNALQLVLGGRGNPEWIRHGSTQAEIEALFDITDDERLAKILEEQSLPSDGELLVRRVLPKQGRSRVYIGGKLATVGQLTEIASGLADIASQHEHHSLVDASTHLGYLDAFAQLKSKLVQMKESYAEFMQRDAALLALSEKLAKRTEHEDLLRFHVQEIDALDMKPGEDEKLRSQRDKLRHSERLMQLTGGAEDLLYARDGALCEQLSKITNQIDEASRLDPDLNEQHELLQSLHAQLEEVARNLGKYAHTIQNDPDTLNEIETRLERLDMLCRKHNRDLPALLSYRDEALEELTRLENFESVFREHKEARERAKQKAAKLALELSERRGKAAKELAKQMTRELSSLGMGDAKVHIEILRSPLRGSSEDMDVNGAQLSAAGIDKVEFLIAPNRGEQPRPLRKVASGGELSRSMLAIKKVLTGLGPSGMHIFDEVDAGVGGAIAEVIGQKLHEVSRAHQVLCITHLPQIAAYADRHLRVHKFVADGRTHSEISALGEKDREKELARMLGGITISDKTRAAAQELLSEAKTTPLRT
ncbi:MAG: DNA repair protein RecN [Myxococcales bacterium]|nr:MAG: DNA repair protein RecN [Myxococcales bacterium]